MADPTIRSLSAAATIAGTSCPSKLFVLSL